MDVATSYDIFNLGSSHPVRLSEMIERIEQATGKSARIRHLPAQPGDVPATHADISKARRILGYDPRTSFSEGIRQTVAWQRSRGANSYVPPQVPTVNAPLAAVFETLP
jgi:UDP-glucuronate 4-epimerase